MLKWAIAFAIIAVLAALLGFSGLAGALAGLAKLLFYAALIICLLLLVAGLAIYWKVARPLLRSLKKEGYYADKRQSRS